ncbi:Dabb family protein (plasmid) [Clostridium botulinum]|uniref:Stress responsive protein n=1 Tax=Clostridium botulinum C/D str. DC5 TaxID=1443128 RepID=A0A0A0HY69_CLOBO|nr:Dabb family protein [Clostridium botulinum]KEH99950.1 stress responsive protein [Clostridium botulinum C/D str. BKT75002]KEI05672.1 stress responsive protein [Clostridium botulinum C/D str. BKT2873]KGM93016.1 stress responsive protein [Clostridium botulinum C/D str. DC5]KOC51941.1 stress responsive protein [Clostridium botulinum]KOC56612.1 stress responsive protein [Clostridium botulinum]
MIKHIVMWKLKEFAEGKNKAENSTIIKENLESLQKEIPEIKGIEVGIDINKSEQAYDVVLYSKFENSEDLNTYQNHPSHVKVGKFIKKVNDGRIVVDYEI